MPSIKKKPSIIQILIDVFFVVLYVGLTLLFGMFAIKADDRALSVLFGVLLIMMIFLDLLIIQLSLKSRTVRIEKENELLNIELYSLTWKPPFIKKKKLSIDIKDILDVTVAYEYRIGQVLYIHFISQSQDDISYKETTWKYIQLAKERPGYYARCIELRPNLKEEELYSLAEIFPSLQETNWQDNLIDIIFNRKK